jgi:hypothetical protein
MQRRGSLVGVDKGLLLFGARGTGGHGEHERSGGDGERGEKAFHREDPLSVGQNRLSMRFDSQNADRPK